MNLEILLQVRKYPILYDQSNPEYNNPRKHANAWEQIARTIYKNQWANLTLQEKAKKVQLLRKEWKSSEEKTLLESMCKNQQRTATVQDSVEAPTPSTSQTQMAPPILTPQTQVALANNEDSIRDVDKELLVLYLLHTYKLLKDEDKQDILHQCYKVIRERLHSQDCQLVVQSEDQPPIPEIN